MKSKMIYIAVLLTTISIVGNVYAKENKVPSCLGSFCLTGKSVFTEKELIDTYGPGEVKNGGYDSKTGEHLDSNHCYYDQTQKVWVSFHISWHMTQGEVSEIFVTKEPMCNKTFIPKASFGGFVTEDGVGINSIKSSVIKTYGKPTRLDDSVAREQKNPRYRNTNLAARYGSPVLVYLKGQDSLLVASFYLKEDIVFSVDISNSE